MTHDQVQLQVDAYLDGELAPPDAREFEAHLRECVDCATLRDARVALATAIRRQIPSLQAPPELRSALRATLRSAVVQRTVRPPRMPGLSGRLLAFAASLVLVAVGSWQLGARHSAESELSNQVLASHIRSLMPGHLTDVISTDQHTVKPWFDGKLDFSPPVYDFAGRGFPLVGGRLEYVGDRSVAALVYQRRKHLINVFLWPRTHDMRGQRTPITRQGYHLLQRTSNDYVYWIVSDLGMGELSEFANLFAQADVASTPYPR